MVRATMAQPMALMMIPSVTNSVYSLPIDSTATTGLPVRVLVSSPRVLQIEMWMEMKFSGKKSKLESSEYLDLNNSNHSIDFDSPQIFLFLENLLDMLLFGKVLTVIKFKECNSVVCFSLSLSIVVSLSVCPVISAIQIMH